MKLYHVDLCKSEVIKEFTPRIPSMTLDDEDTDIPRVCVSESIAGALGAVPWGGSQIENTGEEMIYRIYEFDSSQVPSDFIISPETLVKEGYVPDALAYKEYWIITNIRPLNIFTIKIEAYKEMSQDYFRGEFYSLTSEDFNSEDFDMDDYYLGCCTTLENLKYKIIPENEIITGAILKIDLKELIHFDTESIVSKADYLIMDYLSLYNEIDDIYFKDGALVVNTNEEEGLHVKKFKEALIEVMLEEKGGVLIAN